MLTKEAFTKQTPAWYGNGFVGRFHRPALLMLPVWEAVDIELVDEPSCQQLRCSCLTPTSHLAAEAKAATKAKTLLETARAKPLQFEAVTGL